MFLLLTAIVTLALLDSLNPSTIAAQIFLLLTLKKPVSRVVSFILGTFIVYAAFGFVIVFVVGEPIKGYFYEMGTTDYMILLAIGIGLIAVGSVLAWRRYVSKDDRSGKEFMKKAMAPMMAMLERSSPVHTFFIGIGSTAFDLPTSAFYFVAMASLLEAGIGPFETTSLLLLYNFLYILPLLLILLVYLVARERSGPLMDRVNASIGNWSARLILPFILLIGIILAVISIAFFLNWSLW